MGLPQKTGQTQEPKKSELVKFTLTDGGDGSETHTGRSACGVGQLRETHSCGVGTEDGVHIFLMATSEYVSGRDSSTAQQREH